MPIEIQNYTADHDISKIEIPSNPEDFGERWCIWWRSIQPSWRLTNSSTLPMKDDNHIPPNPDWTTLSIAGENGIVLAIVGLAIWATSVRHSKKAGNMSQIRILGHDLDAAIKDVDLVLH